LKLRCLALALVFCAFALPSRADTALHSLWALHGKHNTVYLLGSIHVLRAQDYPLAPAVLQAYADAKALLMEVNLEDIDSAEVQSEMLASAMLPEGSTLPSILGPQRYAHATSLAHEVGVDLSSFDQFAPWFAAEAISQLQLMELGFQPQSGIEMYFLERARSDGKSIAGLEQAHELPKEVDDMVRAWRRGDTAWFESQLQSELGSDPALYQSLLAARNRKWIPKIEALLSDDKNYLVIVGTGHLVGRNSVIDLLKKDGVGATQR
jgi:hypothetical protein